MKEYIDLDYEEFYDFIKSEEVKSQCYETLCDDLLDEYTDYSGFVSVCPIFIIRWWDFY